ncbi:MAG: hypothetical protein PF447_04020 [Spirochaetaceae bacterium]|jgi:hypothetical protein|nr:hypothetical protein [Spirochaetaceae bacterium]
MDKQRFCESCRRFINVEYLYCPWCGVEKDHSLDLQESIEQSSKEMEIILKEDNLQRMEEILNQIDRDMLELMLSREKKKF